MPRPRRTTANAFYDVFADFPADEQAAALKILEQIHRQKLREKPLAKATVATNTKLSFDGKPVDAVRDLRNPADNAALLLEKEGGTQQ